MTEDPPRRLLLLDSASLYFRAFYGVPDRRRSRSAPPNNAVRGFLDMIATLVERYQPTHLVACWDNDWRPAFRVAAIPSYKTHRLLDGSDTVEDTPADLLPQVPMIVDLLAALGIARVGADGFEADDVIGTLTHQWGSRAKGAVDVVTGDRDLFQLVDDAVPVRIVYTAKGGVRSPDVMTQAALEEKYGIGSGAAYADMAILRGDTSDGLPGVPGIGEKTAAALINRYADLQGLRAALADGDPHLKGARRKNLEEAADYLDAAPQVVRVARDAPVGAVDGALPTAVTDPERLIGLADELDVRSPVNRVLASLRLGTD
ncbi:MAG TPA: 5'-3' exonuclease H3TH domain-containing protein [Segeticoccus sp.]|uniref:5'-3' exonuclease n=1 Tax=Segeticoccus sp. TaxID=2706531 RepID=UPI002D7ECA8A|nr:5'-3' exonuclease H3TH domain-containing protein [Segeticoccus sp.]HET8598937.1 5'-3' exonuclease H3TH domain-containing protein [Segeticoccus sp.]